MRNIVSAAHTPLDPRATAMALAREFGALDRPQPRAALALLLAQIWLETGGRVTRYNFGNEMAALIVGGREVSVWPGDAWRPNWFAEPTESTPAATRALHDRMVASPATAPSAFRAYDTADAGLKGHARALVTNFPALVRAAGTGDAHAFRVAAATDDPLTGRRYSPDYGPAAETSLAELRDEFVARGVLDGLGTTAPPGGKIPPPTAGAASLVALIVAGLAFAAWRLTS